MNKSRLQILFEKYFDKTASPEERDELSNLIGMENHREEVMQLFAAAWENYEGKDISWSQDKTEGILQQIFCTSDPSLPWENVEDAMPSRVRKMSFPVRIAAAAAIPLLIAGSYGLWRLVENRGSKPVLVKAASGNVRPGVFKASLILADGRRIVLDSAGPGQLAQQGNTRVLNKNGRLLYQQKGKTAGPVLYNTLTTGRGETYSFSLADGSKVWLNSGSSIHFPLTFAGKERRIDVTGEIYLQVAKDPNQTFIVTVAGLEVSALGTAFDVNAYADEEKISTTLVEGAVKVARGAENTVLHPGQQTSLEKEGHLSQPVSVDVDEIISWKEGNFQFENADIRTILRQLARWYDVEVIYEGPVTDRKFFGLVSRTSTLADVLQMLKDSGIRFRIEGKKLYVTQG